MKVKKGNYMYNLFKKTYKGSKQDFFVKLEENLNSNKKMFIVTANPETFMNAKRDISYYKILKDKNTTIVADGIGIVKASKKFNLKIKERIPGIDMARELLILADKNKKTLYLFGANEEVILKTKKIICNEYPNIDVLGYSNGYVDDKDSVFKEIIKLSPDIILVGLGIPIQEQLIYKHINKFKKGIFIGVGGSFDVISGYKKRAPKLFINLNLEWLYRIVTEPKRLKRFFNNNIKFILYINHEKRNLK